MLQAFIILIIARMLFCLTCVEVLELPEKKKLNLYELQTIQPKEIVNCLSHLGRQELTTNEAQFIWDSIIQFHNGVANIPEEVLVLLRYVTIAVQSDDYANITLDNIDIITNFGLNYGLSDNQLEAIAERVREDFGNKQPEDYTFYDLTALGQILCAFNRNEINRIKPKAYKEAANLIGQLKNCNHNVMQAFADLATHQDAFGPPRLWTNATVQTVGVVVKYLSKEDISNLKVKLRNNILASNSKK